MKRSLFFRSLAALALFTAPVVTASTFSGVAARMNRGIRVPQLRLAETTSQALADDFQIVTGSGAPSGAEGCQVAHCMYLRDDGTADTTVYVTVNTGSAWTALDAGTIASLSDGTATVTLSSGSMAETGLVNLDLSGSGTTNVTGGGVSTFGDDTAVWRFDGAGAASETGMTTFSLTPSSTVDVDAGGAVTIDSSAAAITIGGDAVAQAVNIATGAAARPIAIGNAASASLALEAGVGAGTWNADTSITLNAGTTLDLDAAGAASLESSGAAITIGGDAVAQNVNIATGAAARPIVIGNAASASLSMEAGVGAASLTSDTTITLTGGTSVSLAAPTVTTSATAINTTAATAWTLIDNNASGLAVGATGDTDMLTAVTTDGSEVLAVGAALGLRLNDSSPLRFGTPGTDLVLTPDGTDVVATSTGDLVYADSVDVAWGTGKDLSVTHNGTDTILTGANGDVVLDNTDTNDQVIVRLGTDTSATGFEVRNNSDAAVLNVTADGTVASAARLTTTDGVASGTARVVGGRAYNSTAASTAITGTAETEMNFDTNYAVPANTLKAGTRLHYEWQGIHTATTGVETHDILVKLGSTTIMSKVNINPADNDQFAGECDVMIRTAGVGGTMVGKCTASFGPNGGATSTPETFYLAETAIDTTAAPIAAIAIDRQATATDSDSARLDIFYVGIE